MLFQHVFLAQCHLCSLDDANIQAMLAPVHHLPMERSIGICTDCGTALQMAKLDDVKSSSTLASVLLITFGESMKLPKNWLK